MKNLICLLISLSIMSLTSGCITRNNVTEKESPAGREYRDKSWSINQPFASVGDQRSTSLFRMSIGGGQVYDSYSYGGSYGYVPSGMGGGYGMVQSDPRNQRQNWRDTEINYGIHHGDSRGNGRQGQSQQGGFNY